MASDNSNTSQSSLRVPTSKSGGGRISLSDVNSIMDAYNSQSKIELIDDNTAMSSNEVDGVKGKNIPLSALRPKTPIGTDENGKPVYSKTQFAEDMARRKDIRDAYLKMNGQEVDEEEEDTETSSNYGSTVRDRLSNVEEAQIEFLEDVPDDNEGILHYLETCINNAEANLEMLKSLYAALVG